MVVGVLAGSSEGPCTAVGQGIIYVYVYVYVCTYDIMIPPTRVETL